MTFKESRLLITFDSSWSVLPFDRSAFFKTLTGQGLKGVDFIGIQDNHLFLIEVKNYTRAQNQNLPDPPTADIFREVLEEKYHDSLRIIRIIHATFRRHMVFRWWQWVASHIQFLFLCAPEAWIFWTRCATLCEQGSITFVLLLIDPDNRVDSHLLPAGWTVIRGTGTFAECPGVQIVPE